ncbi:MAG TPA: ATP-binding cassette domain-containing protein [Humisphaera sp.]|jgi:ABC-type sugar transport system ATPase subunit|nr:ATP-binding cassette domain-containing protein [Humisphaera sp.]
MISVENLSVRAGGFGLSGISFSVPAGSYAVLMGRTGCGKTMLLETLCGLNRLRGGTVRLMGADVSRLKPAARGVGYVPQDRALFMTMSVYENIAFAMRVRRWENAVIDSRVQELGEVLKISHLLRRRPAGLSGGESQRVALGRALAAKPRVLLLDEPLSALDDPSRYEIHELLNSTCRNKDVTVLHVTHHRDDARQLADRLLVMEDGAVREGTLQ